MLIEAMLTDVEDLREKNPLDLVLISGDVADRGAPDEYEVARELLIEPLISRLGVPRDRLLTVPGNHDVDREAIRANVERGLALGLDDSKGVENLLAEPRDVEDALERLAGWTAFVAEAGIGGEKSSGAGALATVRKFEIDDCPVGVAMLNSAWRCSGGADRGSLLVGMPQAEAALREIADCEVRLAVVHHPLEWLAPFESDKLRAELEAHGVIVLSGHEHNADPSAQKSPRGESLYLRAGCLYAGSEYPNSYFLIDIDPGDRLVRGRIRRWAPLLREFSAANELATDGEFGFELPSGGGVKDLGHPPFSTVMSSIAALAQERRVLPDDMSETDPTPGSIEEILIAPRFLSTAFEEAQAAATFSEGISAHEVSALERLHGSGALIVSGDPQSGVSSSLLWLLSQSYRADATKMPAYLSAADSALGTRREATTLAKAASVFGHRKDDGVDPDLTLAVDDLDPTARHKLGRLVTFIRNNPRHRYLLGCENAHVAAIVEALEEAGVEHSRAFLAPFGRTELRKLAKTIKRGEEADVEQIYGLIRTQSLPQTPFTMVALITVVSAEQLQADLNESDLLEAFVKLLLGSGQLADMERLGMNFRRRVVLLAELARTIYEIPEHSIPVPDAERLLWEYFDRRALRLSAGQVLTSLVSRQILIEHDGEIAFRHPALLHLFVGQWMLEKPANKWEMLEDCGANRGPISHAAALKRNDRELLEKVGAYSAGVIGEIAGKLPRERVDELLEGFEAVDTWAGERFDEVLSIMPERKTRAELDAEVDRIAETLDVKGVPLESPAVLALNELDRATTLLSNVLRNSELVADVDLKRELFEQALEGWILMIGAMIAEDAEEGSVRRLVEEMTEEHADDEEEGELVTRFVLMLMVIITGAAAQHRLGGQQLAETIEASLDNPKFAESSTAFALAVWIEAKLELPEWPARLEELLDRLPSKNFLRNATVAFAVSIHRSTPDEAMARRIREVLARHLAPEIKPGQGASVQREVARAKIAESLLQSRRAWQAGDPDPESLAERPGPEPPSQLEPAKEDAG